MYMSMPPPSKVLRMPVSACLGHQDLCRETQRHRALNLLPSYTRLRQIFAVEPTLTQTLPYRHSPPPCVHGTARHCARRGWVCLCMHMIAFDSEQPPNDTLVAAASLEASRARTTRKPTLL